MKRNILMLLGVVVLAVGVLAVTSGRFCASNTGTSAKVTTAGYSSDCSAKGVQAQSNACTYHKAAVRQTALQVKEDCDPSQCTETARAAHPECEYGKAVKAGGAHPGCDYSKKTKISRAESNESSASLVKIE